MEEVDLAYAAFIKVERTNKVCCLVLDHKSSFLLYTVVHIVNMSVPANIIG